MGSQVMEIVVWVLSIIIVSAFLGMMFQVLRGVFDGYMDRWEEKYLVNKKAEYLEENILSVNDPFPGEEEIDDEDDPFNDPDVQAFLEAQDEPGPWDEQYDKSYTVGGLTADKDRDFMKFQNKMDERDKQLGGDSDNNVDDEKEE
jgi:hypothetical protein